MSTEDMDIAQQFDGLRAALATMEAHLKRRQREHERTIKALAQYRADLEGDVDLLGRQLCTAIGLLAEARGESTLAAHDLVKQTTELQQERAS